MHSLVAALACVSFLACGSGDDPSRDVDGDVADTGEVGPDVVPSEGALRGAWPQASIGRPEGVRPELLPLGWRATDQAAPGTGTGFIAAPCPGMCGGTCGIAYELAEDRRIVELQVATGSDDAVFINVVEGADAQHLDDGFGHRSRILRAVVDGDDLLGRDALQPDLDDAATRVGLAFAGDVAFLVRDLMVVDHPDGEALLAFGHIFRDQGDVWAVRDVALGLDPLTGRVRFTLSLPAEIFTINRPFEPTYQAFGARLLSDGRLVAWRDGFVETTGRVFIGGLPRDGEAVELAPLALEDEGFPFSVVDVETDRRDRLYVVGDELVSYPLCEPSAPARPRARLRVFAPPVAVAETVDAKLIHDEGGIARSFEAVTDVFVASDTGVTSSPKTRVFVSGRRWNDPACADAILQYPKSASDFSDDEDDLAACPERLRTDCASGHCLCADCEGLQQICPPSLFGPGPPDLIYVVTLAGSSSDVALAPVDVRAFPVVADGPIATNGATRAIVAGSSLSLLDLSDTPKTPVIWTLPSADTRSGLSETTRTSLFGGWQTPLMSADGTRFALGLLATDDHGVVLDTGAIEHRTTQYGGIVTGLLTPGEGLVARTVGRVLESSSTLVAHGESDRIFPLASGRMLQVFSWRGPAPIAGDTPASDRRLELHLLVPADPPSYFEGKDLRPAAGEQTPVLARCSGTTRDDLDACAYPLPASVNESEVSLDERGAPAPAREVTCRERDRDGVLQAGCDVDTLRMRWEDGQGETLARAWNGRITVRCGAPTVRRVPAEEQAVDLFVGCPTFSERFHPLASASLLTLDHRQPTCDARLGPAPFRATLARVPFDVTLEDETGADVLDGEVGVVIVLTITSATESGTTATYTIVSGSGVLDGEGDEVTVPAGQPVDLVPSAEGVIVIRVRLYDSDGQLIGEQEIAIAVEGASGCTGNADGSVFKPCHPRLPYPPPAAPGAYEARTTPAEAGLGVLLHDRSLRLTELDDDGGDGGLPLTLARTYRSARAEDDGGLMGGWHFSLDMRLAPVTAIDSAGVPDTTWLLDEDLGSGEGLDVAIVDGSGRIDTWRHPGTSELIDFGTGPAWWVWDGVQGRAVKKAFKARVTTFTSPVDSFATLRSYTLILDDGKAAFESHPYWHDERGFRPNERRFYELSDPDGLRRIFDCKGRLVLVIDPQLRELELVYSGPTHPLTRTRRLAAIIDSANRRWSIGWQVVGRHARIATITDPFERTITYGYTATTDGDARLTTVTRQASDADPSLSVTHVTRYRYDSAGRLAAIVDERDGAEVPRLSVSWDGDRVSDEVLGEVGHAETWAFAGSGDTVMVTDGRGTAKSYTLGVVPDGPRVVASESHLRMVVDEAAPLTRREVEALATTTWSHDGHGQVLSATSPLGRVTRYTYSENGLMTSLGETGSDGLTRMTSWQWEDPNFALAPGFACHVLYSETSYAGAVTRYSLPAFDGAAPGRACQPAEVTLPDGERVDGTIASRKATYAFVASGPHRGAEERREVTEDGSPQVTTTWTYPSPSGGFPGHAGKVAEAYVALPSSVTEEVPHPSQCAFEALTTATTTLERDGRGNIVRSELGRRGVPYVVAKTYDAADRVVKTTVDPAGLAHVTTARYDHRDRVVEEGQTIVDDDPLGLLATAAPARTVTRRTYYDAAGREVARTVDGGDATLFELYRFDDASGLVAMLGPGSGASDAEVRAVLTQLEDGADASELLATLDPRNAPGGSRNNYTTTAPAGSPVTPSLDPKWVLRKTRLDADGLPAELETTGGYGGEVGCVGCDGMYGKIEVSLRDLEGRLRVFDPGRTDRGDGNTRVLVEQRYDGLGRLIDKMLVDPDGCNGATTVVRRETSSAFVYDQPGKVEIAGLNGHDACQTQVLARVDTAYTKTGLLKERSEQRFALLPALDATTGARITRMAYDYAGRLVEQTTSGVGAARVDATRYALSNAACWSGSGTSEGWDLEIQKDTDQLGLAAYETELHHGDAGTVTVQRAFDYDALGRMLRARDGFFQIRRELAWDSLGRVRAERDVRGATHESRYDGLGQLVEATSRYADGDRHTQLTLRAGLVVAEKTHATQLGEVVPLGERAWRYDALGRAAVTFPRGPAVPSEAVVSAFGDGDEPLVQRTASGVVLRHEVDALGNVTRAAATFPATLAPGWQIPSGHTFARTALRTFRYDGLGRITEASTFDGEDRRLTHVSRDWDSLSNMLRELQDLDAASGRTQHVDTFARYDNRGRPTRVESDRGRADHAAIDYSFDALDRLIEAKTADADEGSPGLWEYTYPDRITWSWQGSKIAGRSVDVGSNFDASLRGTWTSTSEYDELGQRYRVRHAGPPESVGGGSDAQQTFYENRRWYWAGDPVVEKAVMFQDGVEQGDLGQALAGLPLRGASHLLSRPPAALFTVPDDFDSWDDNPWESSYSLREHDDEGLVVRSVTHRYAPYSGNLSLSGRWQTYAGGHALTESSLLFDPDKDKAIEVKDAAFTWSSDGTTITRATHRLARKVNLVFGPPEQSAATIGGATPERIDRLGFAYGGETQAAHDGCDLGPDGESCVDDARHRFVYDPWGQLEYVAAREPDACRAPGPGADDLFPVADGLRVLYDALGRRVLEHWHLPDGCTGPSVLPAERDRSFVHLGDTLLEERVFAAAGAGDGIIRRVPGPEGVAWLAVRFGGEHRGHFVVFDDAAGGVAGYWDVGNKALVQAGALAPWFRTHQVLALDADVSIAMRLVQTNGQEQQPMGKLAFLPGAGYALDLHQDPLADRWYATEQARAGFFESIAHKVLLALDAVALATAFVPILGDILGLVADLGHVAWDLFQDGPSWGLAGRTMMALGFAAVGLVANLGGPPAWGAKAVIRARAIARAVNALEAGVEVARATDAAITIGVEAERVVHAADVAHDAARAFPDPGAYWAVPQFASPAVIAAMRQRGEQISMQFQGVLGVLFARAARHLAQAPMPAELRWVFNQANWGHRIGRDACGPTAVAMILSDFGIHLNAHVRRLLSFALGHIGAGTNPVNIVRSLRTMGFSRSAFVVAQNGVDAVHAASNASKNGHHVMAAINIIDPRTGALLGKHWIVIDKIIPASASAAARAIVRDPGGFRTAYTLSHLERIAYGPIIAVAR